MAEDNENVAKFLGYLDRKQFMHSIPRYALVIEVFNKDFR